MAIIRVFKRMTHASCILRFIHWIFIFNGLFINKSSGLNVDNVHPTYGPIAGGTKVTITLSELPDNDLVEKVLMGKNDCEIIDRSNSTESDAVLEMVTCRTTPEKKGAEIDVDISLFTKNNGEVLTNLTFSYLPNPSISSISRTTFIKSGGPDFIITGTHFTSVQAVYVTMFVQPVSSIQTDGSLPQENCAILNSTFVKCSTPDANSHWIPRYQYSTGTKVYLKAKLRITMDGVKYEPDDLTKMMPNDLAVMDDPDFSESQWNDIKLFNPLDQHELLTLKGKRLDYAADASDYIVLIGKDRCEVSRVFTNNLLCKPPEEQPEPGKDEHGKLQASTDYPWVQVRVGKIHEYLGKLKYDVTAAGSSSSGSETILGSLVGCAAVLLICAAVVTFFICRRKARRAKQREAMEGFANPVGPRENSYVQTVPGQDQNGYLQPLQKKTPLPPRLSLTSTSSNTPLTASMTGRSMSVSTTSSVPSTLYEQGASGMMIENAAYALPRHSIPTDILAAISEDLAFSVTECLIDPGRLKLGKSIGKGFFGSVHKGDLLDEDRSNPKTVAVKTVQGKHCKMKDVTSFLEEAVVMKDFNHANVLSLLGVVLEDNKPFVILPYMEHGDLKSYISTTERRITIRELSSYGVQIAAGMDYLAKQKFVHRDLATRNCMINELMNVKIADFGLSRDIYKSDYYRVEDKKRPLPVKWMAIESLTEGVFSTKTDVWSFGIVLWELMTRGCSPYPDIDSFKIKAYLNSGRRLTQPEHAPDEIYALMCSCWKELPEDRPSFSELHSTLQDIVNEKSANLPDYLVLI